MTIRELLEKIRRVEEIEDIFRTKEFDMDFYHDNQQHLGLSRERHDILGEVIGEENERD